MDLDRFTESLASDSPPPALSLPLQALWFAAKGDWDAAHERAQESSDRDAAWVHAHLHREEGDNANAAYWYRRAGKPVSGESIDEERGALIAALLQKTK